VAYWEAENSKTPQVDIYTLAASLYFLVTGQEPTECLARKYNNRELIEPKQLNSELSDEINQAILKGVEVYPENRPNSMQEWLNLLSFASFKKNNKALDSRRLIEDRNVRDDKQVNEVLLERNYVEEELEADLQVARNDDREEKTLVVKPFATTPNVAKNENIKQKVNPYLSRESDSTTNKKIGSYFFCSVIMLVVAGYVFQNWNGIVASLIGIESDRYFYPDEQDINEIDFLPDSQKIAIAGGDKVEFWNIENPQENPQSIHTSMVSSLSVNPNIDASTSTVLATGSLNEVELWDKQGNRVAVLTGHTERITEVVFSPDGETLASGSEDETVKLWNMKTQEEIATIRNVGSVTELEYSPDGETLAIGNINNTVKLCITKSEKEIFSTNLSDYVGFAKGLAFSPDGQILAVWDKNVKLFNLMTYKQIATLNQGRSTVDDVEALAFSPDGKIVAVGTKSLIKLWDVKTNKTVNILKGSSSEVNSLSFSPDGKTLANVEGNFRIELWNFPIK
jgi:WD40 repeat protein